MIRTVLAATGLAAAAVAAPACTADAPGAEPTQDRPNVIVILTDDMRHDDLQALPWTREFLDARYVNAHTSTPLCSPSRATLLTGQHSHNHGVFGNKGDHGAVDELDDSETLAVWMQRAGYDTTFFGKYVNGYGEPWDGLPADYVPPGWDKWVGTPKPTTSNYTDYNITVGSSTPDAASTGEIRHIADDYQTVDFTDRAVNRIGQVAVGGDPMFMLLSYFAPHGGQGDFPHLKVPVPPAYAGQSHVGLPSSAAVDEVKVGDKPAWIQALPRLSEQAEQKILTQRRERRDALAVVDDSIARIVDALRDAGELGDTVILFTSDNGYMQGEHRIPHEKTFAYPEAAHVPLLIRGPGFTTGVHHEPVSNVDFAPTIAALAGTTPGLAVDGVSLLDPTPADRPILIEFRGGVSQYGMPAYSGVLQGDDLWVEYDTGARELYDLEADPDQLWNRTAAANMRSTKRGLASTLDLLRDCDGAACR